MLDALINDYRLVISTMVIKLGKLCFDLLLISTLYCFSIEDDTLRDEAMLEDNNISMLGNESMKLFIL